MYSLCKEADIVDTIEPLVLFYLVRAKKPGILNCYDFVLTFSRYKARTLADIKKIVKDETIKIRKNTSSFRNFYVWLYQLFS